MSHPLTLVCIMLGLPSLSGNLKLSVSYLKGRDCSNGLCKQNSDNVLALRYLEGLFEIKGSWVTTRFSLDFEPKYTVYGYKMEQLIYWIPRKYKLICQVHVVIACLMRYGVESYEWSDATPLHLLIRISKSFCPNCSLNIARISSQINRQGHVHRGRTSFSIQYHKTVNTVRATPRNGKIIFGNSSLVVELLQWWSEFKSRMQNLNVKRKSFTLLKRLVNLVIHMF